MRKGDSVALPLRTLVTACFGPPLICAVNGSLPGPAHAYDGDGSAEARRSMMASTMTQSMKL